MGNRQPIRTHTLPGSLGLKLAGADRTGLR